METDGAIQAKLKVDDGIPDAAVAVAAVVTAGFALPGAMLQPSPDWLAFARLPATPDLDVRGSFGKLLDQPRDGRGSCLAGLEERRPLVRVRGCSCRGWWTLGKEGLDCLILDYERLAF